MKLVTHNTIIVMLMLVAFIGQAVASNVLSYTMVSCTHQSMQPNMAMTSHTPNHANMMSQSMTVESENNQTMTMDCCQEQCECSMNGCVNLSLLLSANFSVKPMVEQKILSLSSSHSSHNTSLLYRPPIS